LQVAGRFENRPRTSSVRGVGEVKGHCIFISHAGGGEKLTGERGREKGEGGEDENNGRQALGSQRKGEGQEASCGGQKNSKSPAFLVEKKEKESLSRASF